MRLPCLAAAALAALILLSATLRTADAAALPPHASQVPVVELKRAPEPAANTLVRVQLVVVGAAVLLVVVAGTGAYVLRRKLGLTAYNPDPGGDGHH